MNFLSEQKDTIVCGDCFEIAPTLPDSSIDLIIEDGPYHRVKNLDWDRQHKTADEFLVWKGEVLKEYRRVLKLNGSLYVFASPKMAARVEVKVSEYFNVLENITWVKPNPSGKINRGAGRGGQACKEKLRSFFPRTEEIIFAEHYGADNAAKGESGYGVKCDELRGFVFEPLRAYLYNEWKRAGLHPNEANTACGFVENGGMATRKYFGVTQWQLPTEMHYQELREYANSHNHNNEYLCCEYEDLRAEYEDLRAEYEDLRRPFSVTAQDQYTDVWEFPTVKHYPGKHPCEKPLAMIEHIIKTSSRPGDLVADFFCGSGVTAEAAVNLGRRYFCCDIEEKWVEKTKQRVGNYQLSFMEDENGISRPL